MSTFKKEGFFVLSLKDGTALPARKLEACPEGVRAEVGGISTLFSAEEIGKTWQIQGDLPVDELEHFSKIGAALLSLEDALTAYRKNTGRYPFTSTGNPLIFGATSLAFTLSPFRSSEDIDLAVSQDFLDWTLAYRVHAHNFSRLRPRHSGTTIDWGFSGFVCVNPIGTDWTESNWNPPLDVGVDLCSEDLLDLCGRWRERAVNIAGLTDVRFRLLHPLDVVAQKLLRRSEDTFFGRDVLDIESVMERLNPPKETLIALLTECAQRYNPTPNDSMVPSQYEAVMRNTSWFLERFLPGMTVDEIAKKAWERKGATLGKIGLAPGPVSLSLPLHMTPVKPETLGGLDEH